MAVSSSDMLSEAEDAFYRNDASGALELLDQLQKSYGSEQDASSHLLRGLIYEYGGEGVEIDLVKAIANYRVVAMLILGSDPIPYLYLARALMKQGPQEYSEAFKYIQEADAVHHTPEVDLAFAYFYETAPVLNIYTARKYYLKAALSGRFAGFFGCAATLRKTNNKFIALIVDCVRVLLGPLLFLVFGKAARRSFNGY